MNKIACQCAFCENDSLDLVMDFGPNALAGGFLSIDQFQGEKFFSMRLCFCSSCFAVQIIDQIPPDDLFKDYFYFSSSIKTLSNHFEEHAKKMTKRFLADPQNSSVLEFGCNDGILLKPLAREKIGKVIGIDPATNVINSIKDENITTINDFLNISSAKKIIGNHGRVDLIFANNVFAHISDMRNITQAIKNLLKDEGVFIFEVHYLDKIINELQYDMIYHEHIYYHSFLSLENHFKNFNLKIFDAEEIPIHGGSMRYFVSHSNSKISSKISENAISIRESELKKGFHLLKTYQNFASSIEKTKIELMNLLNELKRQGKRIVGYGASGRANTLIQYCGINHNHLDYIVDDAPAKLGFFTPGSHFEIKSKTELEKNPPDFILVFAWSFFKEIAMKNTDFLAQGGKMISPLPALQVIEDKSSFKELS